MPRTLPWLKSGTSSTTRPKRPAVASTSIQKRQKSGKDSNTNDSSFTAEEDTESSTKQGGAHGVKRNPRDPDVQRISRDERHPISSSPPPSPPSERFMVEGIEDDDKYRMVEDEFLTIAQRFTVHLHAAEYKRQQKMAKTRNAETISSISRPVTGKMPNQTKRKLEAIERAKTQKTIVQGLVGKKIEPADDSEDDVELPYIGTSLHGLMDSPSKKKASLKKIGGMVTTRAAAGYKKPAQSKSDQRRNLGSPEPRSNNQRFQQGIALDGNETESSGDENDLDIAPKPIRLVKEAPMVTMKKEFNASIQTDSNSPPRLKDSLASSTMSRKSVKQEVAPANIESPPKFRSRISRFELARARKLKQEEEEEAKKKLEIIPSFL